MTGAPHCLPRRRGRSPLQAPTALHRHRRTAIEQQRPCEAAERVGYASDDRRIARLLADLRESTRVQGGTPLTPRGAPGRRVDRQKEALPPPPERATSRQGPGPTAQRRRSAALYV